MERGAAYNVTAAPRETKVKEAAYAGFLAAEERLSTLLGEVVGLARRDLVGGLVLSAHAHDRDALVYH